MLTRYLGSTTAAVAVVLSVFMAGLAVGSYFGGKISKKIPPLRGYMILEVCIAAAGLLSSFVIISAFGKYYLHLFSFAQYHTFSLLLCRIVFSMACLILPTALMGATLPFLVEFTTRQRMDFQVKLSALYSINTFGAALGVFVTGFILIGFLGEKSSLLVAALFNIAAAFCVYKMRALEKESGQGRTMQVAAEKEDVTFYPKAIRVWSYAALFVSGFTALAYEIIWVRYMMIPLETSVYAFSTMLGLFLVGIGAGSLLSSRFTFSITKPLTTFAFMEIFISLWTLAGMLVFGMFATFTNGYRTFPVLGFTACVCMIVPIAILFGWQFPVAVRCSVSSTSAASEDTGRAYALNTLGTILGSLLAGFVFLPVIGTGLSLLLLSAANLLIGFVLYFLSRPEERKSSLLLPALALTVLLSVLVFKNGDPYRFTMHIRIAQDFGQDFKVFGFDEGVAGTTVSAAVPGKMFLRNLYINGVGVTRLCTETKLMAHLPLALVENPRKMLVICFGMGTTVRSAGLYRGLIVEAVDIVPRVFDYFPVFHHDAAETLKNPNIHLYGDDGRNFLLARNGRYDVITIDPSPPIHSAGTVNLYTREFFELCKSKLSQSGLICLWVPPAPAGEALMIMKTFRNVFPEATLWGGIKMPGFYLIGGHGPLLLTPEKLDMIVDKMRQIDDLGEWDAAYKERNVLKNLYLLGPDQFALLVQDADEVTDDHPFTEFPLWRSIMNVQQGLLTAGDVRNLSAQGWFTRSPSSPPSGNAR
jgi:spermidine synthase